MAYAHIVPLKNNQAPTSQNLLPYGQVQTWDGGPHVQKPHYRMGQKLHWLHHAHTPQHFTMIEME